MGSTVIGKSIIRKIQISPVVYCVVRRMECFSISGGELFERVVADDFTLTERDCILFLRQICEGVSYMHKNHVVHLDLKVSFTKKNPKINKKALI